MSNRFEYIWSLKIPNTEECYAVSWVGERDVEPTSEDMQALIQM